MSTPRSSSLDLFLLALIQTGINTPYLFRERAQLSVGATLPALKRLEAYGLVRRAERGVRNKQEFEITAAGKRAVATGILNLLHEYEVRPPNDIPSLLRLAALSQHAGSFNVERVFSNAAKAKKNQSMQLRSSVQLRPGDVASIYSSLLATWQATALSAEAQVLTELADLARLTPKADKGTSGKKRKA